MADEHFKWLSEDAAERLLRGEPLDAVDGHERKQAERLAELLDSVRTVRRPAAPHHPHHHPQHSQHSRHSQDEQHPVPAGARHDAAPAHDTGHPSGDLSAGELPGEAAALAAFRVANAVRAADAARAESAAETGAVRIGRAPAAAPRTRWGRPMRFGLAAVVAACTLGGVAVAAGAGVIPTPFGGREAPQPGATVSAEATPSAQESPRPDISKPGLAGEASESPDGKASSQAPGGQATPGGAPSSEAGRQPTGDGKDEGDKGKWAERAIAACRAYRNGTLDPESKKRLERAAGGAERVRRFCDRVLDAADDKPDKGKGDDGDGTDPQFGVGDGPGDGYAGGSSSSVGSGNHHESNGSAGAPADPDPTYSTPVETPAATPAATPRATTSQGV
ncbi:hypothetical protein [Streptomyces sp. NBC_01304]|uniref:hypothetical protein n=1 Tax=Streptomyces sp. NBC_01304 TaxID=2903818 RepID=UPI002E15C8DB|nr:hypothetical protein OG430_19865 [Streptomyces sp. NBC_01304]